MDMKHRYAIVLFITACAILSSCQKQEDDGLEQIPQEENTISMNMVLNGGIHLWDNPQTKAIMDWPDGCELLIQFHNNNGRYPAKARFNGGSWTLILDGSAFINTDGGICECYFFENWSFRNRKVISLGASDAIYEGWGEYTVSGGTVTLNVTLSPKTGRIRFNCPKGLEYLTDYHYARIHGLTYYTQFDLSTFSFETSDGNYLELYLTPDTDQYIYCGFTDYNNPTIIGYNNEQGYSSHYERTFDVGMLDPGHSVICEWPIYVAHNEWLKYESPLYPLENGSYVEFFFIPSGSFMMGGGNGAAYPAHWVNLTKHYYIQQGETSRDLWYYALEKPSGWQNDSKPVVGKTWDEIQEFIFALNVKTGLNLRLPTEAEWEWAGRGAWYGSNEFFPGAYRGSSIQRPGYGNYIGMSDMFGNAGEFVQDWYAPYSAAEVTDPKGPATGDYHVIRGGDITSPDEGVTVYARSTEETSLLQYTGFRLAMDVPGMYDTYTGPDLYAPSRLPFKMVPVGQTAHAKLTVRASRKADATFQIQPQGATDAFTYSPSGEIVVPAGGIKEVDFTFSPTQATDYTAQFNVVSSSLTAPINVKVSGMGRSEEDALIQIQRKYLIKNPNGDSYMYPRMSLCFDNGTFLHIGYYNTSYYDGWYHGDRLWGTFIYPSSGSNYYNERTEEPWIPCDQAELNTWVNEKILVYSNSDVDYYVNDVYLGTYSFATLDLTSASSFYLQCTPEGASSNYEHWMDDFSINLSNGYSYSDSFDGAKLNMSFWEVPVNPAGVKVEDGVLKTIQKRGGEDYNLNSKPINLWQ